MTDFRLNIAQHGDVVVAQVEGEIDFTNAAEIESRIQEATSNDMTGLAIDLSGTDYVDSAGVRMLFDLGGRVDACRQRMGIIVGETSPLRRLITVTNLQTVAAVCATLDECLPALRRTIGDLA